jgi:hypothetical protein
VLLQKEGGSPRLGRVLGSHGARRAGTYDGYVKVVHAEEMGLPALVLTFSRGIYHELLTFQHKAGHPDQDSSQMMQR